VSLFSSLNRRKLLEKVELLTQLPPDDLDRIAHLARRVRLPGERTLIHQGAAGSEMYVLVTGRIAIQVRLADGKTIRRGTLCAGDSFGEIALFDHKPRSASVVTLEPCEFLVLDRSHFVELLREYPDIAIRLLQTIAQRFRAMDETIKETLRIDIPKRLAKGLTRLLKAYGKRSNRGVRIDAPFSDQDLAEITGLEPDLVSVQLRAWRSDGLIRRDSLYITICDTERLSRIESD
jgi:CRP-like cAMP-binding protein